MSANKFLAVIKLVDLAASLVEMSAAARESYNERSANLKAMAAEGRDPTDEEMAELDDAIETVQQSLQERAAAARERLNNPQE